MGSYYPTFSEIILHNDWSIWPAIGRTILEGNVCVLKAKKGFRQIFEEYKF